MSDSFDPALMTRLKLVKKIICSNIEKEEWRQYFCKWWLNA